MAVGDCGVSFELAWAQVFLPTLLLGNVEKGLQGKQNCKSQGGAACLTTKRLTRSTQLLRVPVGYQGPPGPPNLRFRLHIEPSVGTCVPHATPVSSPIQDEMLSAPRGALAFMAQRISPTPTGRARRYSLHFQVYFRERDSPKWLEGTTENISHTGVLFLSSSPFALETALDLRLSLEVGTKGRDPAEIRCKGAVVRLEKSKVPGTPIALAVAIRDYRIVRQPSFAGSPTGSA